MTAEDFCDFFEAAVGVLFHIFDELFGDDFLVIRTTGFYFYVAGCLISPFPSNNCANIYFEHARSLKSLSSDIA